LFKHWIDWAEEVAYDLILILLFLMIQAFFISPNSLNCYLNKNDPLQLKKRDFVMKPTHSSLHIGDIRLSSIINRSFNVHSSPAPCLVVTYFLLLPVFYLFNLSKAASSNYFALVYQYCSLIILKLLVLLWDLPQFQGSLDCTIVPVLKLILIA
jgi:hypothetical protein